MVRKIIIIIAFVLVPLTMFSQAQINTKKAIIEDFPEKVTKVVLSGNVFIDTELEAAVRDYWRISPYEFCTLEQFKELKGSSDYYFLMTVKGRFRKEDEPGLMLLTVVKGGKRADGGVDEMLDVVTAPLCSAEYPSGREVVFIAPLLDIIQTQIFAAMASDKSGYSGLKICNKNLPEVRDMKIVFAESDLAFDPSESLLERFAKKGAAILADDEADKMVEELAPDTVVSYSVYPTVPEVGSYCYNMLIGAGTHKLYYFKKTKIKKNSAPGFTASEVGKILKY